MMLKFKNVASFFVGKENVMEMLHTEKTVKEKSCTGKFIAYLLYFRQVELTIFEGKLR